jgi:hypothetical protein
MKHVRETSKKSSRSKANDEKAGHPHSSGVGNELARAPVPALTEGPTSRSVAMRDLGANDADFGLGITSQMLGAFQESDTVSLKFAFSFIKGVNPRDQIEGALAAQMSIVHQQTMRFASRLANARGERELIVSETIFTKLTRTYTSQMDALKRYRATSDSGPNMPSVSVRDGGQAIVGHVTQNVAISSSEKIARGPLAIEDGRRRSLPPVREQAAAPLMSPPRGKKGNG